MPHHADEWTCCVTRYCPIGGIQLARELGVVQKSKVLPDGLDDSRDAVESPDPDIRSTLDKNTAQQRPAGHFLYI